MSMASQLLAEARKHHEAKRFAEAEGLYRRIVEATPDQIEAWVQLGMACAAQGKLREAIEVFQRVLAAAPDHVEALTQLGIVFAKQRRLPEALAKLSRAVEL